MLKKLLINGGVMVTLKELEKQRIHKIESLNGSQIKNYVDVLVKDICKLHDSNNVINPDDRLNEMENLYDKLKEIKELTGGKFGNISNYINITLNADLTNALTVEIQRYIVKDANAKNFALNRLFVSILSDVNEFKFNSKLLYDILSDDTLIATESKKEWYIDELRVDLILLKDDIEKNVALIDGAFYSDETIKNDIHDIKVTIKDFADSDDGNDKLFVEFGLIPILADLIKAYENHADIKKRYIDFKPEIDELFADSGNVFKKYSVETYDTASGISFKNFMKSQPKFNIDSHELVVP